jgi:predicted lipoprotein with Yx(FWY)xxD motif
VLATATGHTLYVYKPDTPSTTAPVGACTGGCLGAWPIYYGNPVSVPSGVSASDIRSFSNAGTMQSTYMGWPLYTYTGDSAAGTANGNGTGGVWFAVKIPFTAPK